MKRALLVDGSNIYKSAKGLGFRVDYKKLLSHFQKDGHVLRAFYFTALPDKSVHSTLRKMVDWISYNGYTVIQKETKEYFDEEGIPKLKGNMDIEIAVCAWKFVNLVDEIVLFSGDGDFRALVERIQELGVSCHVVSSMSMCADLLRRQADKYTDLSVLRKDIEHKAGRPRFLGDVHG